jgi:hypothetical protein
MRIHPVFHVGVLKANHDDPARPRAIRQPMFADEDGPIMEVEAILDYRVAWVPPDAGLRASGGKKKRTGRTRGEYLVQWKALGPEHASWEPDTNVVDGSPRLLAEFWHARGVAQPSVVASRVAPRTSRSKRGRDVASCSIACHCTSYKTITHLNHSKATTPCPLTLPLSSLGGAVATNLSSAGPTTMVTQREALVTYLRATLQHRTCKQLKMSRKHTNICVNAASGLLKLA